MCCKICTPSLTAFLIILTHEMYTVLFVLPQIYQTVWSAFYGISVRLHCFSSGSVDSKQEDKVHSMARWSATGLEQHNAT